MADNVDSLVLSGCECSKTITPPTYSPENTLEYVKVKKTFLANYLKELKLHSTPSLVCVKPCYGKQLAKVRTLNTIFISHQKDLKRLKQHINDFQQKNNTKRILNLARKPVAISDYIESFLQLNSSFAKVLSTFYKPDDHIPVLLLIQAAQANFLSITVFESSLLLHDGSSIRETRESKA
jgi:hypothetical protein